MIRTFSMAVFILLAPLAGCAGAGPAPTAAPVVPNVSPVEVAGALQRWHPVTLTFQGPHADERGTTNPFRDFRLEVTFRHAGSGTTRVVPGYFAADGNAAESGASAGTGWRAHLTPAETGEWSWTASFRAGRDVAILGPDAGAPTAFDGATGSFTVTEAERSGRDFRGRGMLRYVGGHHLRFENGDWFLKGGVDSPETLLAYEDFDGTRVHEGSQILKRYAAHLRDWRDGDPTWRGGRGKGLIGALNYLASEGLNGISFLTMNVEGDGRNVWPWIAPDARDRYDVSKLAQWERVFTHADSLGLHLHFKTQETENDQLLDGGALGPERRLYYRELVARFGHHLALNWNLGEENDAWEELADPTQNTVRSYAAYLRELDPYDHPIVIHSYPQQQAEVYGPLLGPESPLTGVSLQTAFDRVHADTRRWVEASRAAGRPWVVANDEQGSADVGVTPDGAGNNHDAIRHQALWGNLMAGGAGVEYYFGYRFPHSDLNLEDFRSRDRFYDYTRHALAFFEEHLSFWEMEALPDPGPGVFALGKVGEVYALYLPPGSPASLALPGRGRYTVRWYDPREGGALQAGSVATVTATGAAVSLGSPPRPDGDWVILLRAVP